MRRMDHSVPCPKCQNTFRLRDLHPGYGQTEGCFCDRPRPACWQCTDFSGLRGLKQPPEQRSQTEHMNVLCVIKNCFRHHCAPSNCSLMVVCMQVSCLALNANRTLVFPEAAFQTWQTEKWTFPHLQCELHHKGDCEIEPRDRSAFSCILHLSHFRSPALKPNP